MSGGNVLNQNKSKFNCDEEDTNFFLTANPVRSTMRGASQIRRQHLNRQIFKNLRLRDGAEKMLHAREGLHSLQESDIDQIGETLKAEISFYDTRLKALYCELANLRSSFDIFQSASRTSLPIIALSLKDAIDIDWKEAIEEVIESHYHENPEQFKEEIQKLTDLRQLTQTPERNEKGVQLLYEYYNQLWFVEKRLFRNESLEGIEFIWYDALTAHQKSSKTISFEKASVLFNIGVLWTQIAAKKEFNAELKQAQEAIIALQKAAGIFTYLKESVRNHYSTDLTAEILDVLVHILKVQTNECALDMDIIGCDSQDVDKYNTLARGAAQLSRRYEMLQGLMSEKTCIPPSWCTLAEIKSLHFKAVAHYYAALILLQNYDPDFTDSDDVTECERRLSTLVELNKVASWLMNEENKTDKAKSHIKKALVKEKKAMELATKDRFIARLKCTQKVLSRFEEKLKDTLTSIDIIGDLDLIASIDDIQCSTDRKDKVINPEFLKYKVTDIFSRLGPLSVFNANLKFNRPEIVTLNRRDHAGFGISIRGHAPTIICKISKWRENGGVQVGDVITAVESNDVKSLNHKEVSKLIQGAGNSVTLTLISSEIPNTVLNIVQ